MKRCRHPNSPWYGKDAIYEIFHDQQVDKYLLLRISFTKYDAFCHALRNEDPKWHNLVDQLRSFSDPDLARKYVETEHSSHLRSANILYKEWNKHGAAFAKLIYACLFLVLPLSCLLCSMLLFDLSVSHSTIATMWAIYWAGVIVSIGTGIHSDYQRIQWDSTERARLKREAFRNSGNAGKIAKIFIFVRVMYTKLADLGELLDNIAKSAVWPVNFVYGRIRAIQFRNLIMSGDSRTFFSIEQFQQSVDRARGKMIVGRGNILFSLSMLVVTLVAILVTYSWPQNIALQIAVEFALLAPVILYCSTLMLSVNPYRHIVEASGKPILELLSIFVAFYVAVFTSLWITLSNEPGALSSDTLLRNLAVLWDAMQPNCVLITSCDKAPGLWTAVAYYVVGATIAQSITGAIFDRLFGKGDSDEILTDKAQTSWLKGDTQKSLELLDKIRNHHPPSRTIAIYVLIDKGDFDTAFRVAQENVFELSPMRDRIIGVDECCVHVIGSMLAAPVPLQQDKRFALYAYISHRINNRALLINSIEGYELRFSVDRFSYESLFNFLQFFEISVARALQASIPMWPHSNIPTSNFRDDFTTSEKSPVDFCIQSGLRIRLALFRNGNEKFLTPRSDGGYELGPHAHMLLSILDECAKVWNTMDYSLDQISVLRFLKNSVNFSLTKDQLGQLQFVLFPLIYMQQALNECASEDRNIENMIKFADFDSAFYQYERMHGVTR